MQHRPHQVLTLTLAILILVLAFQTESAKGTEPDKPTFNALEVRTQNGETLIPERMHERALVYLARTSGEPDRRVFPSLAERQHNFDLLLGKICEQYVTLFTQYDGGLESLEIRRTKPGEVRRILTHRAQRIRYTPAEIDRIEAFLQTNQREVRLFRLEMVIRDEYYQTVTLYDLPLIVFLDKNPAKDRILDLSSEFFLPY